jgi:CheY-like chemotaxis protein
VPPVDERYLFDPFHRGANAATNTPGNGLGLHLVRRMMEAQNGSVMYRRAAGGGASFVLALLSRKKPYDRKRILLVEDEAGLRRTLSDLLASEGYSVESAADGLVAQELAIRGVFDLIVLDVMLPSRSGFDVCRYLRKNGVQTPVLMLTARSELNNKVQGFQGRRRRLPDQTFDSRGTTGPRPGIASAHGIRRA